MSERFVESDSGQDAYLTELKNLVQLHAVAQGISATRCREILSHITHASGSVRSSWANQWIVAGERALAEGNPQLATAYFNLGRFPYIDSPERKEAHQKCIAAFSQWQKRDSGIFAKPLQLQINGRRFVSYVRRCGKAPVPLILVMGGIVSIKEQWAGFLRIANRINADIVVTEFPGVGENELSWDDGVSQMMSAILDALQVTGESGGCYPIALSFGGMLALRQAARDPRIRGITTGGAPVHDFFRDESWWTKVPETTRRTLGHILGRDTDAEIFRALRPFALEPSEIERVRVPIFYIKSARDEIIPRTETDHLAAAPGGVEVLEIDDVHGSPKHIGVSRIFFVYSIFATLFPESRRGRIWRAALAIATRLTKTARFRLPEKADHSIGTKVAADKVGGGLA